MKQHRLLTIMGVVAAVVVLVSHSVDVLFLGGPTPAGAQVFARALALLVLGLSQALFLFLLVAVAARLAPLHSSAVKLALAAGLACIGAVVAPLVALPFVVGIRSLCFTSSLCSSEVVQFVPHALYVAAGYPSPQVLLVASALLFAVLAPASLGASALARPQVVQ